MFGSNSETGLLKALVFLTAACVWIPVCGAADEPIRLVASDERGVILELNLPAFELEETAGPDGTFQRIRLPGWCRTVEVGHPELPRLGTLIQVPERGEVNLTVLENRFTELPGCMIRPVPGLSLSDEGEVEESFERSDSAYSSPNDYPGMLASIDSRAVIRGVTVARILFYPFQWNPSTWNLRCSEKIRIRVSFEEPLAPEANPAGGRGAAAADSLYGKMMKKAVINYTNRHCDSPNRHCDSPNRGCDRREQPPASLSQRSDRLGYRMEIMEDGVYRVTYEDLLATGVNPQFFDPQTFQVFNSGEELAIDVKSRSSHRFSPGDHIEFYAEAIGHNVFTETNVYWLYGGAEIGLRMPWTSGAVTGQGQLVESFEEILREEKDFTMWDGIPGGTSVDWWFWEKIYAPYNEDFFLNVPSPVPDQTDAVLRVCYQGRSTSEPHPNHHTRIYVNGTLAGDDFWDGDSVYIQEMTVPQGVLLEGDNTITLELPNDTGAPVDIIYLNWFELYYRRDIETFEEELTFSVDGIDRFLIDVGPFRTPNVRIFDITKPYSAEKIEDFSIEREGTKGAQPFQEAVASMHPGGFSALFESDVSGARRFHVIRTGDTRHRQRSNSGSIRI